MNSQRLRIGIAGLGHQGRAHLQALQACCASGLCDPVPRGWDISPDACTRIAAEMPGMNLHDQPEAFLDDCDAVVIATPPFTYGDADRQEGLVFRCAQAGKHLLLEKPPGLSLRQALGFRNLAEGCGILLDVAVQRRYHPAYAAWESHKRRLGIPLEIDIEQAITKEANGWRADQERCGGRGALFDLGFHAVDLALMVCGDMRFVSGVFFDDRGRICNSGMDVKAEILLQAEQADAPVRICVERARKEKMERVTIRTAAGTLEMSSTLMKLQLKDEPAIRQEIPKSASDEAMTTQLRSWIERIQGWTRHATQPAWHSILAMRLMEEAYAHGSIS